MLSQLFCHVRCKTKLCFLFYHKADYISPPVTGWNFRRVKCKNHDNGPKKLHLYLSLGYLGTSPPLSPMYFTIAVDCVKLSSSISSRGSWLNCNFPSTTKTWAKQECIPIGCVPPAIYRTWGSVQEEFLEQGGLCPGGSVLGRPSP